MATLNDSTARELPLRKSGRVNPTSRWIRYLPEIYHESAFLDGMLQVFEILWAPLDRQATHLWAYFDPLLTPHELLSWLASWVALTLDQNWPIDKQRQMIAAAAGLYPWRGTRHGLIEALRLFTGETATVEEAPNNAPDPFHFTIRVQVANPDTFDEKVVRRIVDEVKPAHTTYDLIVQHR